MKMRKGCNINNKYQWSLCFNKAFDTFSYLGTQTILILYFINIFQISKFDSYLIYGAYATIAFSSPILGGIITDRWLGSRRALIFGSILNIFGNLMLMSFNLQWFCIGLTFSLIGAGIYKSSATSFLGSVYSNKKTAESGFTWLYLTTNIGGVFGPLVYGLSASLVNWNFGFFIGALGLTLGLIWFLIVDRKSMLSSSRTKKQLVTTYLAIILFCFILSLLFTNPKYINYFILLIFLISIIYLYCAISKYKGDEKKHLIGLTVLSFFSMFYFAAGMQIGSLITLFIQEKIDTGVITTTLPASTFTTLYPLFVLLVAPIFSFLWRKLDRNNITVTLVNKLTIGMFLASIGILMFIITSLSNHIILGVAVGIFFLSAGEMALTPAMYTAIGFSSPLGMKNTMLGCWFLAVAFGSYLSSLLANLANHLSHIMTISNALYFDNFLVVFTFIFFATITLAVLTPKIHKLIN